MLNQFGCHSNRNADKCSKIKSSLSIRLQKLKFGKKINKRIKFLGAHRPKTLIAM